MGIDVTVTDENVQVSTSGQTVQASVSGGVGPAGPTGPQGPAGAAGATGATGPQGPTGPAGTTTWSGITGKPSTFPPNLTGQQTFTGDNDTTGTINGDAAYFSTLVFANLTTQTTAFTNTLKTKLDGIATGATANATDAQLRDRSTHTGTQAASTITGLAASATTDTTNATNITSGTLLAARLPATTVTAASYGSASSVATFTVDAAGRLTAAGSTAISVAASAIASGTIATARLASGTASSSTFLRGDQTWAAAPVTSVDGSTGDVSVTKSAIFDFTRTTSPSGATGSNGSWTWSIPTGAKRIHIWAISGGSGGGSGRRGAAGTNRFGGGGGIGGTAYETNYMVSDLPSSSLSVYVGFGGSGGAAVTTDNTDGNNGTYGDQSRVQCNSKTIIATRVTALTGGRGGTVTSGAGATNDWGSTSFGNQSNPPPAGGSSSVSSSAGGGGEAWYSAGSAGAGGGIDSSNVARAGGAGGMGSSVFTNYVVPNGGAATGANGDTPDATAVIFPLPGWSGAGGGGNASGAGGNGSSSTRPGTAGGGGGASVNGFNSGAGGNGGPGHVRITVWY